MTSNLRLVGIDGLRDFFCDGRGHVYCVKCTWWLDGEFMPATESWQLAATHECSGPWLGFTRYTIAPERAKGRRTA